MFIVFQNAFRHFANERLLLLPQTVSAMHVTFDICSSSPHLARLPCSAGDAVHADQ